MKRGFTLIELLVVITIIAILVSILVSTLQGCVGDPITGKNFYSIEKTEIFRCVKTYTSVSGSGESAAKTSKRVDLKPASGGMVITMECNDDFWAGVNNSATVFAQFENGRWYEVDYVGFRRESSWRSRFPLIKSAYEVDYDGPAELDATDHN